MTNAKQQAEDLRYAKQVVEIFLFRHSDVQICERYRDELINDCMLRVWQKRELFNKKWSKKTWISCVVRRTLINKIRNYLHFENKLSYKHALPLDKSVEFDFSNLIGKYHGILEQYPKYFQYRTTGMSVQKAADASKTELTPGYCSQKCREFVGEIKMQIDKDLSNMREDLNFEHRKI